MKLEKFKGHLNRFEVEILTLLNVFQFLKSEIFSFNLISLRVLDLKFDCSVNLKNNTFEINLEAMEFLEVLSLIAKIRRIN